MSGDDENIAVIYEILKNNKNFKKKIAQKVINKQNIK